MKDSAIARFVLTALVVLTLAGGGASPAAEHVFKIATLAPDGTAWMKALRAGAEEIARQTSGRVQLKFYPGGVMGSDATVLRKIQVGQLQGGAVALLALGGVYPDIQLYGLPLLFRSEAEVDYVRARVDATLLDGLERRGLVAFGLAEGGFAYLMSSTPIRRLADLRAEKVWAPEGDEISRVLFEVAGVAPVVLPLAEVYTGLQTGLLSAVGISPAAAIALQWHARTRYLTDLPLFYTAGTLVIDKGAYARLSAADQETLRRTLTRVFENLDRASRRDNEAARLALGSQGIQFLVPEPQDVAEIERIAAEARARIAKRGLGSPGLLQTVEGHLREFRGQGEQARAAR